ncbi:hypothetical protein C5167_008437 [Papaver somniferum]|uniref:Uncharacterized protein n=1 Tax=Papaver somniferum TaxID=3469 RepID=A0A4Y7JUK1_PAPSO|nr:hypothetical protein C5167_008437 [Papaver somniferum]
MQNSGSSSLVMDGGANIESGVCNRKNREVEESDEHKMQKYLEYNLLEFRVQQKYELIRFEEYHTMEKDWNGVTFNEFMKLN